MKKTLITVSALLLTLLLALPALADDRSNDTYYFGGTGQDTIYQPTVLPNGCLLLNGSTQLGRNGQEQLPFASRERRAWLLCLNPDLSVAWEATDDASGTTRYVIPQLLEDGRISVLYYNSPSQVDSEIAIHLFTQDGRLVEKKPLPLKLSMAYGAGAGGYLFYAEDGWYYANGGEERSLPLNRDTMVYGFGTRAYLPLPDGWLVAGAAGRSRQSDPRPAVARLNAQGREVWRFSPDKYVGGEFGALLPQADGSLLFCWSAAGPETKQAEKLSILCLDPDGRLLWERPMPAGIGRHFTPAEEGYVFARTWQEKTYTHIRFTLVNESGEIVEVREAEPRRETLFGGDMFTWNGEAWFLADTQRSSNRVNDRQDLLELQDASLIRVKDCPVIGPDE